MRCAVGLLAALAVAAPGDAGAAVVVTDLPAFGIAISAAEGVAVDCGAGNRVRVTVDGTPTTYNTLCAAVTTLDLTAAGGFVNTIDLVGVGAQFGLLGSVTITGGPGADVLLGSQRSDTFVWGPGDGSDTLDGRPGSDTVIFNGSAGMEHVALVPEGTGFDLTRDVGAVALDVVAVESVTVSMLGANDTVTIQNLTGVAGLALVTVAGGDGDDVLNGAAQVSAVVSLVLSGGIGTDTLTGGAGPDTLSGGDGNDSMAGGAGADVFTWNPGDDNDTMLGGPGSDTLDFNPANISEQITLTAEGGGFDLFRDVAAVSIDAGEIEVLDLPMVGGDDAVITMPLLITTQRLDGGIHTAGDVLAFNAQDECVSFAPGRLLIAGFGPVEYAGFETVAVVNTCRGDLIFADGFGTGNTSAWSLAVP